MRNKRGKKFQHRLKWNYPKIRKTLKSINKILSESSFPSGKTAVWRDNRPACDCFKIKKSLDIRNQSLEMIPIPTRVSSLY